jgi:hypothetical protein
LELCSSCVRDVAKSSSDEQQGAGSIVEGGGAACSDHVWFTSVKDERCI